ncbi:MAG: hypothetical protein AAF657_28880 [Acidobacteriota bacterium]
MTKVEHSEATDRFDRLRNVVRSELPAGPRGGVVPFHVSAEREAVLVEQPDELPNRYEIRDREDGRMLMCGEAPRVAVSIDRNHQFSEADARRLGERVVFLDGAGQFAPVIDNNQQLYNLDHHQDCLRAFTLATCQQALIVVVKGLELDRGDWTVFANEPDLDTVFAIWVLLNHRRVRQLTPQQRDLILPLIHLEGAIDANGFELAEHCGLPQAVYLAEKERLDKLHAIELELKSSGGWQEADLVEYTRSMLLEIDRLVYHSTDLTDYASVDEVYGHVDIGEDRVAVVCRDSSGIYEVEKRLKKTWGDRLGIIALERVAGQYTLRRTAALASIDLEEAYGKLNLLDPGVDGRPPEKRWGGSDEIGGSPRPSGTALTPREIGKILKMTYKRVRPVEHLQRYATAALWALLLVLGAGVAVISRQLFLGPESSLLSAAGSGAELLSRWVRSPALSCALDLTLAALVVGLGALLLTRKLSRGWTWLFGWRQPAGRDWLLLLPVVLVGAAVGGAWVPQQQQLTPEPLAALLGATVLAALALELCFRGLVHGLLILDSPVQTVGSRWFVSGPVLAQAGLYALATVAASRYWIAGPPFALDGVEQMAATGGAALVVGIALGMIRERTLSVWPAALAALLGALVRIGVEVGL